MKNLQECNVVMLPTEKSRIVLCDSKYLLFANAEHTKSELKQPQHLYITNPNEEIKEFDYILLHNETVCKYTGYEEGVTGKIIATTDESLTINTYINQGDVVKGDLIVKRKSDITTPLKGSIALPQIPTDFIKQYCEQGGIDKVLVEYGFITTNEDWSKRPVQLDGYYQLKVSPTNTISIKPIKESWSREEVIELFKKLQYEMAQQIIGNRGKDRIIPVDWIKENL